MGPSGLRPGHERNTRLWTPRNVVLQGDNVAVQGTEVKKLPLGRPAKGRGSSRLKSTKMCNF